MVFYMNGERVVFNVDQVMRQPSEPVHVNSMDYIEHCVKEMMEFMMQTKNKNALSEEKNQNEVIDLKAITVVQ